MSLLTMLFAFVAFILTLVAFIPLLGWLNWLFIPLSAVALVLNVIMLFVPPQRNALAKIGIFVSAVSLAIGIMRLGMGWGII